VSTVLGSCVAVCLWDARLGVGGLNHYMLPFAPAGAAPSARYGDVALPELLTQLAAHGATPPHLRAHVFGGAHVMQMLEHSRHLGVDNVELALRFLAALHIPVVSRETGGTRGMQVHFQTDDGAVRVRTF
jgi:chemotaxis protein CheD